MYVASLYQNTILYHSYCLYFFFKMLIHKFWILNCGQFRNIKFYCSQRKRVSLNIPNLLKYVVFLEITTHLSPKPPTALLLSRSQWTISSLYYHFFAIIAIIFCNEQLFCNGVKNMPVLAGPLVYKWPVTCLFISSFTLFYCCLGSFFDFLRCSLFLVQLQAFLNRNGNLFCRDLLWI